MSYEKGIDRVAPEVRRALCPSENGLWIADQNSPTNIVARVHLRGHIAGGLLDPLYVFIVRSARVRSSCSAIREAPKAITGSDTIESRRCR